MTEKINNEKFEDIAGGSLFSDANRQVLPQDDILPIKDGFATRHTCKKCGREFEVSHWANEKALPEKTTFCRECRNKKF